MQRIILQISEQFCRISESPRFDIQRRQDRN